MACCAAQDSTSLPYIQRIILCGPQHIAMITANVFAVLWLKLSDRQAGYHHPQLSKINWAGCHQPQHSNIN
jgi:hypothetical protein